MSNVAWWYQVELFSKNIQKKLKISNFLIQDSGGVGRTCSWHCKCGEIGRIMFTNPYKHYFPTNPTGYLCNYCDKKIDIDKLIEHKLFLKSDLDSYLDPEIRTYN
jgi:hypothetical protein